MSGSNSVRPKGRFVLVDSLRGLAALGVVLRHVFYRSYGPLPVPPGASAALRFLVAEFNAFCLFGATGVEVFFVLSGFVIAHSLREFKGTPREVGRFILRRQLRLDPPYWVALFLMMGLCVACNLHSAWELNRLPTGQEFVLNFLYLQYLVPNTMSVLNVSWTLCLEIQFYLAFILILWMADGSVKRAVPMMFLTGAASLLIHNWVARPGWDWDGAGDPGPFLFPYWYHFVAGTIAYWAMSGMAKSRSFGWYALTFAGFMLAAPWRGIAGLDGAHTRAAPAMMVGFATSVLLWHAGRRGKLESWLDTPALNLLGRISYSLYLTHEMSIWVAVHLLNCTLDSPMSWSLIAKALAICASVGVALVFHLMVERPSLKFAAKLRGRPGAPAGQPALTAGS